MVKYLKGFACCFYKIFASLLILLFLSIVFEDIFHIHDWPSLETVTPYHFGLGTKINHKNILFYETKTHVAKLLSFFQVSNLMKNTMLNIFYSKLDTHKISIVYVSTTGYCSHYCQRSHRHLHFRL